MRKLGMSVHQISGHCNVNESLQDTSAVMEVNNEDSVL